MPESKKHTLILTGPYTGKTVVLNGYQFVNGVLEVEGSMKSVEGLVTYMSRSYRAYLKGSDELEAAQKRDKEAANGERNIQREVQQTEEPNSGESDVQPEGKGPAAPTDDNGSGSADDAEGTAGDIPSGDGHEDAGIPETETGQGGPVEEETDLALRKVVQALDPEEDSHWTEAGKPAIAAIEKAYDSTGVTRKDVNAAAPGWDRDKAREAKDLESITG